MKLPGNLNIIRGRPKKRTEHDSLIQPTDDPTSDWLDHPEKWDRALFIANSARYLARKNGGIDAADKHLLSMLASQIEIYVESIIRLRTEGLVITFNGGVTVGPNPHTAIADRALYRSVQVMKELELSPKSRAGYQSTRQISPAISRLLAGP